MAGAAAAIVEFFAADGAAATVGAEVAGAGAAETIAAGGIVDATAAGYGGLSAAGAGSLGGGASVFGGAALPGAAGAGALAGAGKLLNSPLGAVVAGNVASSLLAPKIPKVGRPDLPKPLPMPDPATMQQAAVRRTLAEQSRSGRASTILTSPAGGDKLGG